MPSRFASPVHSHRRACVSRSDRYCLRTSSAASSALAGISGEKAAQSFHVSWLERTFQACGEYISALLGQL